MKTADFFVLPQWSFQKVEQRKWGTPTKCCTDFSHMHPVAKHLSMLNWHIPVKSIFRKGKNKRYCAEPSPSGI